MEPSTLRQEHTDTHTHFKMFPTAATKTQGNTNSNLLVSVKYEIKDVQMKALLVDIFLCESFMRFPETELRKIEILHLNFNKYVS